VPTPVGSPPACHPPNGAFGIFHRFNHHLGPALWGSALQVKFTFIVFNERTPPPLDRISNNIMKGIVWYGCDIFVCNAPRMNAMIYYLSQCYQNTNNFFIKNDFLTAALSPNTRCKSQIRCSWSFVLNSTSLNVYLSIWKKNQEQKKQ